jgi:hypothetical protein
MISFVPRRSPTIHRARLAVIAVLLGAALLIAFAKPASACSCQGLTPTELAQLAEVIFTGVARSYVGELPVERATIVEFDVGAIYKGEPMRRIQVEAVGGRGPSGGLGPGCEYGFQIGRLYTVFAIDPDGNGTLNTNGCLQNVEGPITPATYGLGPGQAPSRTDEALPLMVIGGVAMAAVAVLARLASRRSHQTTARG